MGRDGGRRGARRFYEGQEVLSITAGRRATGGNETWWWNDQAQDVINAKKEAMKMCETSGKQR